MHNHWLGAWNPRKPISTFSIVAADPDTGDLGVAVASKFLSVGAVVPWARAGVGAVATQAHANTEYGPEGLSLLAGGVTAQDACDRMIGGDPGGSARQLGIVSADGGTASFTGSGCTPWAGGVARNGFACQGNILSGPEVVDAMRASFESSSGPLGDRLLEALRAGDEAGGDSRGRQSAALLVVRDGGGYGGRNDRFLDLRIDDHPGPIPELFRLRELHKLYFERPTPGEILPLTEELTGEIQSILRRAGEQPGDSSGFFDEATHRALETLFGRENLEERWVDGAAVDATALRYLRREYG